jgi:3-oxoacyl-[acyl-carrier protein] reductase
MKGKTMNFIDKTALVTGSGSGIGKAIALMLAKAGADVVINDVNQKDADATAGEIELLGRKAISIVANVADLNDVRTMFEQLHGEFGKLDILVNNAGITSDGFLMKMTEDQWDRVMDVNLKGVFNCCQLAARIMSEHQYGKIVNITSASAQMGNVGQVNYAASKGGVISVTKTLAKELAQFNINVNAVAPGFIETPMTDRVPEKVKDHLIDQIPLRRAGTPEDVANAVCFLASDKAAYITGQILACNGGMVV